MFPQRQTTSLAAGGADVADVTGRAARAAVDVAVRDDAAADARADLDQQQMLGLAPVRAVLAERHDVDVVVDEHRRAGSGSRTTPGSGSRPSRA